MLVKWILGNEHISKHSSVIWNAIGGAVNAGQSAIVLIFVSHKLGIITAGIVTIAYAIANLFMTMGKYGIRNFQVTDVNRKYSFSDYFFCRVIVLLTVLGILFLYLGYCYGISGYSASKVIIIFEVTFLKMIDAIEDVYLGRYQQVGRLDVAAKIMAVRIVISTIIMCLLVVMGVSIYFSILGGICSSVVMDIYFVHKTFWITNSDAYKISRNEVFQLLKVCFPLFVGTTLSVYIGNVPKYMINNYMDETVQAIFGYIMMPVFVIMLLSNFIYQPIVKDLGDLWEERDYKRFNKKVVRQCVLVALMTVVIMLVGLLIGLPILSILYGVQLTMYQREFAILLLGGGFYALAYFLNVPITTIRKQNYIAGGYAVAAIVAFFCGKYLVTSMGILGAAVLYLCINIFLVLIYACVLSVGVRRACCEDMKSL